MVIAGFGKGLAGPTPPREIVPESAIDRVPIAVAGCRSRWHHRHSSPTAPELKLLPTSVLAPRAPMLPPIMMPVFEIEMPLIPLPEVIAMPMEVFPPMALLP